MSGLLPVGTTVPFYAAKDEGEGKEGVGYFDDSHDETIAGIFALHGGEGKNGIERAVFAPVARRWDKMLSSLINEHEECQDNILIKRLPPEIFVQMFGYLNVKELDSCWRVCKRWNAIIDNESKRQDLGLFPNLKQAVQQLKAQDKEIARLESRLNKSVTKMHLFSAASVLSCLIALYLFKDVQLRTYGYDGSHYFPAVTLNTFDFYLYFLCSILAVNVLHLTSMFFY